MMTLVIYNKINLLNIILALSPAVVGTIGIIATGTIGAIIWYFVKKSQLNALHQKAIKTLHHLQKSLSGLNEALEYLNKHPEIINIGDNLHASDISQVISEYLNFTDANILGNKSIGKAPMTKAEAQEFIDRITNSIKVIEPIKKNNVALVEGIKTLETLEDKKHNYEQNLPGFNQRIQAIEAVNTHWWHEGNSFTEFADLTRLHEKITADVAQGWTFLKSDGSTQAEAQGIGQINKEVGKLSIQLDQMAHDLEKLETNIKEYQIRLPKDLTQIGTLKTEIDHWQNQYTYVIKTREQQIVTTNEQQTRELAQANKKDWKSIIHHLDTALNTQLGIRDYFIKFDNARQNYENKLSHTILQLYRVIEDWLQHPDYTHLPSYPMFDQELKIAQNGLESLLAKTPETDWLTTEETAQELITNQETLIKEFEAYKAAHQTFIRLDANARVIDEEIRKLEEVVILQVHSLLPEIDQKQRNIENTSNWFDKLTALEALLDVLERYANDLENRRTQLYNLYNECNQVLAQAQELLNSEMLPDDSRYEINQLSIPNFEGREYETALTMLESTLMKLNGTYRNAHNYIQAAHERFTYLTGIQSNCYNAVENARTMQNNELTNTDIQEAIAALEVPNVEGWNYDEAIRVLQEITSQANDLYNQAQDTISQ